MVIHGLQKLTLLDYPGHTACTVFTAHCPWRCPFCHNASLVLEPESQPVIPEEEIFVPRPPEGAARRRCRHRRRADAAARSAGVSAEDQSSRFCREARYERHEPRHAPRHFERKSSPTMSPWTSKPDGRTIPPSPARCVPAWPPWRSAPGCSWTAIPILNSARRSCAACTRRRILPISPRGCRGNEKYFLQAFKKDSGDVISGGCAAFTREEMKSFRAILLPAIPKAEIRGMD